jgi:hypothetical protein
VRRALTRDGAIVKTVVEVIKAYPDKIGANNARVQSIYCEALSYFGGGGVEYQQRAGAAGGVEALVKVLRTHATDAKVQASGCMALTNTCYKNFQNVHRAVEAGGVEAVVEALKTHAASAAVQQHGFRALSQLCATDVQNVRRAVEAGGVEAVVEALKTHAASAAVQTLGSGVIFELCAYGFDYIGTNVQNVRRAVEAGAAEVIVRALEGHVEDVRLQIYGCKALWKICEGPRER